MLPGLRKNRSRLPFADRSTVLRRGGPVEDASCRCRSGLRRCRCHRPDPTRTCRRPSPTARGHCPRCRRSCRCRHRRGASRRPWRPRSCRFRSPPSSRQGDRLSREVGRRDRVVAVETVDGERVDRVLVLDRHPRGQAGQRDARGVSAHVDGVVALGAVDDDAVGRAVAGDAAERAGEVGVDGADIGAGEVVDRDRVGTAERVEVDRLDAVGVHRDAARGCGRTAAGCRSPTDRPCSAAAAPLKTHRVGAGLAFDGVAAIARIPDERVVARAQLGEVVAPVAVDRVVPGAAAQLLHSGTAGEVVVSVPAVERRRDAVGEDSVALVDAHEVVAAAAVDDDPRDELALDAELGRAVVADVDLENVGSAGLQAKRNPVARARAPDDQRSVLRFGPLEHDVAVPIRAASGLVGRGGLGRPGRDPACAGDHACHGHCHARKPRRANVVGSESVRHLCFSPRA